MIDECDNIVSYYVHYEYNVCHMCILLCDLVHILHIFSGMVRSGVRRGGEI